MICISVYCKRRNLFYDGCVKYCTVESGVCCVVEMSGSVIKLPLLVTTVYMSARVCRYLLRLGVCGKWKIGSALVLKN